MSADEPAMEAARKWAWAELLRRQDEGALQFDPGRSYTLDGFKITLTQFDLARLMADCHLAGFAAATAQNAALVAQTIAEHAGPERRARDRDVGE